MRGKQAAERPRPPGSYLSGPQALPHPHQARSPKRSGMLEVTSDIFLLSNMSEVTSDIPPTSEGDVGGHLRHPSDIPPTNLRHPSDIENDLRHPSNIALDVGSHLQHPSDPSLQHHLRHVSNIGVTSDIPPTSFLHRSDRGNSGKGTLQHWVGQVTRACNRLFSQSIIFWSKL